MNREGRHEAEGLEIARLPVTSLAGRGESQGRELVCDVVRGQALACVSRSAAPVRVAREGRHVSAQHLRGDVLGAGPKCGVDVRGERAVGGDGARCCRQGQEAGTVITMDVGWKGRRAGDTAPLRPRCVANARTRGSTSVPKTKYWIQNMTHEPRSHGHQTQAIRR